MAKSRKSAAKGGARKPTRRRPARAKAAKKIELRPIRRKLETHRKVLRGAAPSAKVKNALRRIERCLAEIRGICGPDMSIPLD